MTQSYADIQVKLVTLLFLRRWLTKSESNLEFTLYKLLVKLDAVAYN